MHVIGTAGHIDHGKSTLIRALTGIDPDRLKEEKERGMTIDLGFAWITLPSGREAGIVDVPGHHKFVRNMLAGVGGIDLVLFVVAATESWMPQSQEHLDIINLLGIKRGLVVLTKADLVEHDWLDMVTEEVREKLIGSSLEGVDLVPVDSVSGAGLDNLRMKIDAILADTHSLANKERPRLWIDRVFTIRGSGTVVTGTLEGGFLKVDQAVQVLPSATQTRIRGLQTHRKPVEQAEPGSRVAVNLTGLDVESLQRGDALVALGQGQATDCLNVQLRLLSSLNYELPQKCELKLHLGTAELLAQVRLLEGETLVPGQTGLAQLCLERSAAVEFGDRFILRDATRQETVGGGTVLDSAALRVRGRDLRLPRNAPGAYRVLSTATIPIRHLDLQLLRARATVTPAELPLVILAERGWATIDEIASEVPVNQEELSKVMSEYAIDGRLVLLPTYTVATSTWSALVARFNKELNDYHERYPLRLGLSRETLRSGLGMVAKLFEEVVQRMNAIGEIESTGALLHVPGFTPTFTSEQQRDADKIVALLNTSVFSPLDIDDLVVVHGFDVEVVSALLDQGRLVKLTKSLVCTNEALQTAKEKIAAVIFTSDGIDVGAVRDTLGTSRKFAVPLLEYLDQVGYTKRIGDKRILA